MTMLATLLPSLLILLLLPHPSVSLPRRSARIVPIFPRPSPPPPPSPPVYPSYLSPATQPFYIFHWPDASPQTALLRHLRTTYSRPLAHLTPAHRQIVTPAQLESQIRHAGSSNRFIQLSSVTFHGRLVMRFAFALDHAGEGVGQRYFALMHVRKGNGGGPAVVMLNGVVKASGVQGMEKGELERPGRLSGRTLLTGGQAGNAHEVFDAVKVL